eukprot:1328099-Rhodomonas_salina.1
MSRRVPPYHVQNSYHRTQPLRGSHQSCPCLCQLASLSARRKQRPEAASLPEICRVSSESMQPRGSATWRRSRLLGRGRATHAPLPHALLTRGA